MDNEFYRPDYLYQYTTIESLALILKTRSIKFNSLAFVDDLEEMKGIRIGLPIYPFEDSKKFVEEQVKKII